MSHRRRRLSTDGEQRTPRRTPSPSSCEKTHCPSCGQRELTAVNVDDELPISICSRCDRSYGVDDSMDAETLALLLSDEELCRDFRMTVITCDQCFNNDVYHFRVVDRPHADRLRVMCMDCSGFSDIPLTGWDTEGPGDDVGGTLMDEALDGVDEDDGGSSWDDVDSGYDVDSDDDDDVESWNAAIVDVLPFSCRCGNNEVDCFQEHFNAASGDLSMVTCLVCDHQKEIESFFGVECGHCGNGIKDLFERDVDSFGRMTRLRCLKCGKRLQLPGQPSRGKETGPEKLPHSSGPFEHAVSQTSRVVASAVDLGRTKIEDLRDIKRGDHIAWHKWYAAWHHGIAVDDPDVDHRKLTVIHYNGGVKKLDGHLASVRLETIDVNPKKEDFYRIDYPAGATYPPDEVVLRAGDRVGEAKYNPLKNNCEHFARWCKTGRSECGQVRTFGRRVGLAFQSAATKVGQVAVADGLEAVVARSVGAVGKAGLRGVFGATSGVVRNLKCGALACNVVVNLGLEAAMLTKDALGAYRKYKSGAISCDDFRRALGKVGCESVGGLVGSTGLGILGQIFVPVPIVGGIVGCILGNLIGRWIGAVVGKTAIKRKSAKMP